MAKNWYLKEIAQERTATGEKFQLITNVPCHLWMRWTLVPPKTHRIAIKRRGIIIRTDLYFCFDVYEDNEQAEPGDTIIHTFTKEPWPYCQERWYYFHGEIAGIPSKSTSATFYKHPKAPPGPVWQGECWGLYNAAFMVVGPTAYASTFIPQVSYILRQLLMQGYRYPLPYGLGGIATVKLCPVSGDTLLPPIATTTFNTEQLKHGYYNFTDFHLDFPPAPLVALTEYAVQFWSLNPTNTNYSYNIRTSIAQPPINAKRLFYTNNNWTTHFRQGTGAYMYFHGKFYKSP